HLLRVPRPAGGHDADLAERVRPAPGLAPADLHVAHFYPFARLRGPARLPIPPSLRRLACLAACGGGPSSLVPRSWGGSGGKSTVQAAPRPFGSLICLSSG